MTRSGLRACLFKQGGGVSSQGREEGGRKGGNEVGRRGGRGGVSGEGVGGGRTVGSRP